MVKPLRFKQFLMRHDSLLLHFFQEAMKYQFVIKGFFILLASSDSGMCPGPMCPYRRPRWLPGIPLACCCCHYQLSRGTAPLSRGTAGNRIAILPTLGSSQRRKQPSPYLQLRNVQSWQTGSKREEAYRGGGFDKSCCLPPMKGEAGASQPPPQLGSTGTRHWSALWQLPPCRHCCVRSTFSHCWHLHHSPRSLGHCRHHMPRGP